MTDHQTEPDFNSHLDNGDTPTPVGETYDLSVKTTPPEWFDAERDSPQDKGRGGFRNKSTATVAPILRKADSGTLLLSGVLAAIVVGGAWMAVELLGLFGSPWLAVPAGILIALIIRAGSGAADPDGRATVAAISYLAMFLVVMTILTRREVIDIYGDASDIFLLEENLFRRRFSRIDQLVAYTVGWAASWLVSSWLRN
jgi:hypothetical protein